MPSPYNIDIENSCTECTQRHERLFCNMSAESLAAMNAVKFTSLYPKGATLFVEGEEPRGVTCWAW